MHLVLAHDLARPMTVKNQEQADRIMLMIASGYTQKMVATKLGLARSTVSEIVSRERAAAPIDREAEMYAARDLLDNLIRQATEVAEMGPAPVTAGKDGEIVMKPGSDTEWVEDHSGRLAAMQTVKQLLERKSKLLGLDSPARTEVSGGVTYTIAGLPDGGEV